MKNFNTLIIFSVISVIIGIVFIYFLDLFIATFTFSIFLIIFAAFYFGYTGQISLRKGFNWDLFETKVLNSIIGVIILSWIGTFSYNLAFPGNDEQLLNTQNDISEKLVKEGIKEENNQAILLSELEYQKQFLKQLPQEINTSLMSSIQDLAKEQNRIVQDLIDENKELKNKLLRLTVFAINEELQEKVFYLFYIFKYEEANALIKKYLKDNTDLPNSIRAKLYYQMSLAYIGSNNFTSAKNMIEKAISFDSSNVTILRQYADILKAYKIHMSRNIHNYDDNSTEAISNNYILSVTPEKSNIVYRGIKNPVSIHLMGVPDNQISVFGEGVTKSDSNGKYIVTPGNGKKMNITVKGKLNEGKVITKVKELRIKDIPNPVGLINGDIGFTSVLRNDLSDVNISVILPAFGIDMNFVIKGFNIVLPNNQNILIDGNKLDRNAIDKIKNLPSGTIIKIEEIDAALDTNSGYKLKNITKIAFEII